VAGSAFWGLSLALLQPLAERVRYDDGVAPNTYWARDLRLTAIVLVIGALLVALNAGRLSAVLATAAGVVWVGADVLLDRADVGGPVGAVVLTVVPAGLVLGAWSLARRRSAETPSPGVQTLVVVVAAATAPLAALTAVLPETSAPAAPIVAPLLGAVAVVLMSAAAIAVTGSKARRTPSLALLVIGLAGVAVTRDLIVASVLGAVLLSGVALVLAGEVRRWWRYLALALALTVTYFGAVVVLRLLSTGIGAELVAWAGNPQQVPDDDPVFLPPAGLVIGLLGGAALYAWRTPYGVPTGTGAPAGAQP
jgi:hypothetical protein